MSYKRYGGSSYNIGLDFSEVKQVHLNADMQKTMVLPVNGPLNQIEKSIATQYIHIVENAREGPFYSSDIAEDRGGINDGIKRYSDRYLKSSKPKELLRNHPFKVEFFPEELLEVLQGRNGGKKGLKLNKFLAKNDKIYLDEINGKSTEQVLERLNKIGDVEEEKNDDAENEVDEEPDDFDDEDDDDYNAEKYFDDGEDFGDDMDGGDEPEY